MGSMRKENKEKRFFWLEGEGLPVSSSLLVVRGFLLQKK
jgi:hypothetical protein